MLVTNGSRINEKFLESIHDYLDWITLSIDSADPDVHRRLGRVVNGQPISLKSYLDTALAIRAAGIALKVNTVVSALNAGEDLRGLIFNLRPDRWKLLQMLPVRGQNDGTVQPLLISQAHFAAFAERHADVNRVGVEMILEDNTAMTSSYAMVDPLGRFFDNSTGAHRYSSPILDVGLLPAWHEVTFNRDKFVQRGGIYDWAR